VVFVSVDRDKTAKVVQVDSSQEPVGSIEFAESLVLTKSEVFDLCSVLADLRRVLHSDGHVDQALWVEALFERLEERIATC
jgi:hypothetical protein